ncbi:MAG: hypothetical protein AAB686_03920, partial [Patescibacteria group bacterium]
IRNRAVASAQEILYTAAGGDLPDNVISSKEAIAKMRQIPGYENLTVQSVEMIYGPDGSMWYWGIKTDRGTVTIEAR